MNGSMNKVRFALGTACIYLLGLGASHAALIDRGGGLIYDDVLNVTWLQDVQYMTTQGYAERLSWADANAWVSGLEYVDTVRGVVWDDWRLPSTINDPSSRGWDITGTSSELAYMYYINLGYEPSYTYDRNVPEPSSSNYNPFINLAYRGYWSGTEYVAGRAWGFHFHFGAQEPNGTSDGAYVWAVRDGDVDALMTSVPEPGTLGLFAMTLAGLGLIRRKQA